MTATAEQLCKLLKAQHPNEAPSPALLATGLATDTRSMDHDQVMAWLVGERQAAIKAEVVASFLAGVERNHAYLRAALSAYSCAMHLPEHSFTAQTQLSCQICSFFKQRDVSFIALNRIRFWSVRCRQAIFRTWPSFCKSIEPVTNNCLAVSI